MQKKEQNSNKKVSLTSSVLSFFNRQLTEINNHRLYLNRGKNIAKFLAKSQKNIRNITPMETTLGVMSFALYFMRFSSNIGLLIQLYLLKEDKNDLENNRQKRQELYYSLWNDALWSLVNMAQFFWLSFKKSASRGYLGMQLETTAQLIDSVIMLIRHLQDKKEYERKYQEADLFEKARLEREWRYKELNFIRSLVTISALFIGMSLFAFQVTALPLAPFIAVIKLLSTLIQIIMAMKKDQEIMQAWQDQKIDPKKIAAEKRKRFLDRMQEFNQLILYQVFLPLSIFMLLSTPLPVVLISAALMAAIYFATSAFLKLSKTMEPEVIETDKEPILDNTSIPLYTL